MAEEKKSLLYKLKPLTDRMPAVKKPEGHVHFRTKMLWVILILVLYFAMTNVMIYGLDQEGNLDLFAQYRAILAGAQFSLMHLGIGPIVTGSIIMQLFTGAKIIRLNLKDADDKAIYQGTQKFLVIIMILVESVPQVFGFLTPSSKFIAGMNGALPFMDGDGLAKLIIIMQLFVGSYLVFLMDEVVSKWGIGSGISLFIAAGVSQSIFTGSLNWQASDPSSPLDPNTNPPVGTIPKIIYLWTHFSSGQLSGGGYEGMFLSPPNPLVALLGTVAIFFIVTYAESSRIELPLAHGGARGARGRYPIKLIYASNIPVILMAALLANVSMFSMLFWQHPSFMDWPILGHNWMLGFYEQQASTGGGGQLRVMGGLAYYLSSINGVGDWLLPLLSDAYLRNEGTGHDRLQILMHVVVYVGVMVFGSVLFAKFWIETTNMGPEAVASQIESSGMQIPGFRRDPRVLRRVLERYIPVVTVISGAAVGGLASGADLLGTVGNASGTGVLLTVGIMINLYEAIGREQMMEMHPVLRGFFGGG
jgi:preprotein translocase subunit SecY